MSITMYLLVWSYHKSCPSLNTSSNKTEVQEVQDMATKWNKISVFCRSCTALNDVYILSGMFRESLKNNLDIDIILDSTERNQDIVFMEVCQCATKEIIQIAHTTLYCPLYTKQVQSIKKSVNKFKAIKITSI